MAWIESHDTLARHPKKDRLAELLFGDGMVPDDVADFAVIGLLHRLWWWALDYAQDGDLSKFSDRQLARGCEWRGDATSLVRSLTVAGFLDEDRCIHDWGEYTGRLVSKREQNRRRAKASYDRSARRLRADTANNTSLPTQPTKPTQPTCTSNEVHTSAGADGAFESFWTAYPRKTAKQTALKAWRARLKGGDEDVEMIAAAGHYAEHCRAAGTETQYIKHPATFIGPDRPFSEWVDGIPEAYRTNGRRDLSAADLFAMAEMAEAEDVPESECEVIP